MNNKYTWEISSFCNDSANGEANSVEQAISDMLQTPLSSEDWIQGVIIAEKDTDNHIIMAVRGNYDKRFYQHGVQVVPELDILMDY